MTFLERAATRTNLLARVAAVLSLLWTAGLCAADPHQPITPAVIPVLLPVLIVAVAAGLAYLRNQLEYPR